MATEEHKKLSSIIKNNDKKLRLDSTILGPENAWKKHCENTEALNLYSRAMLQLATNHWEPNSNKNATKVKSRIKWVHDYCKQYFFEDELLKQRKRELVIAQKINVETSDVGTFTNNGPLQLLDVGSCYNPFSMFKEFEVLPIDIAPAVKSVIKCDFLKLEIFENQVCDDYSWDKEITQLSACKFDVVVFSLLLQYLPCPEQRMLCCSNAYKLLKIEGLLVIISPDSKHVGANSKFIKSWQYNLAKIGFSRIKYEKFSHIHCMAFRKCLKLEITQRWITLQKQDFYYDKLFIPQDFNQFDTTESDADLEITEENKIILLNELPYHVT